MTNYIARLKGLKKEINYYRKFFRLSKEDIEKIEKLLDVTIIYKQDNSSHDFKWIYTFHADSDKFLEDGCLNIKWDTLTDNYIVDSERVPFTVDKYSQLKEIIDRTHLDQCEEGK